MIKLKLTMCLLLLFYVSAADDLGLSNGYMIKNVQLTGEFIDSVQYKGFDIEISLKKDQILYRELKTYYPIKPSRFLLSDEKIYENYFGDLNRPDTASQIVITTVHGEVIRGDISQNMTSVVVLQTEYGLITIARDLIADTVIICNEPKLAKNNLIITMLSGESFEGEQISSTDSTVTYQLNVGYVTILKRRIFQIERNVSNNRTFLLGNTFTITKGNKESFNGVLLSATDSTETYNTETGVVTVPKRNIRKRIMIACGAPLDKKFLLYGNSFTVTKLNGESFDGMLISSTDSTVTYQKFVDSVTVLKKDIVTVLNTSLNKRSAKYANASTVSLINKESFYGKIKYLTDSTKTYETNIGDVTIHERNIFTVAKTLEDVVYEIKDAGIHLPSLFSIYSGVAIPTGDFTGPSVIDGGVQPGFTAGVKFVTGGRIGLLLDISYSYNRTKINTMKNKMFKEYLERKYDIYNVSINNLSSNNCFNNIIILAGLKLGTKNLIGTNYFIAPILGIDLAITPKYSGDYSGSYYSIHPLGSALTTLKGHFTQTYSSDIFCVYGVSVEVIISNGSTISARYIHGEMKYDLKYPDDSSVSIKQNVSLYQICLGVVL